MEIKVEKFSNKSFDGFLEPFLKGLKQYFGLSTKGSFVFLASYGLKFPESYHEYFNDPANADGPEWRDDTDTEYDAAVDILIERYSATKNLRFKDVRMDAELLKKVVDELMKIATSVAKNWLSNELMSFKKGVSGDEKAEFVQLVSEYLKELNEDDIQF